MPLLIPTSVMLLFAFLFKYDSEEIEKFAAPFMSDVGDGYSTAIFDEVEYGKALLEHFNN